MSHDSMELNAYSVLIIIVCLLAINRYLSRNHRYWQKRGVPGPRPWPFFGTYLQQFCKPFCETEVEWYNQYGKIYGIYDGSKAGIIVGDPDLIKQIMVKDFHIFTNRRPVKTTHPIMSHFLSSLVGEEWKRVRSITTPIFTSSKMKKIFHVMTNSSSNMLDKLEYVTTRQNNEIDLKELYGDYTMDVIAKSAFATNADSNFVKNATKLFTFPFWRKFLDYAVPMWLLDSLNFTVLPADAMNFFRSITIDLIDQRRNTIEHDDFLALLMNAETLSVDEILAQSVLFFTVGFETVSQLLTYCTYCLALNPDCQQKLYDEIGQMLSSHDGDIDYDIVSKMAYLDAVISETLRLYSPVLRMERQASEDYVLGDTGIVIEKGMIVGIPIWALHHDAKYYVDPYRFDPERFSVENRERIVPFTYLPFGVGPRNCIGTRFALLEAKVALIKVLSNYRFVKSKGTKIPLRFLPIGRPLLYSQHVAVGVQKRS